MVEGQVEDTMRKDERALLVTLPRQSVEYGSVRNVIYKRWVANNNGSKRVEPCVQNLSENEEKNGNSDDENVTNTNFFAVGTTMGLDNVAYPVTSAKQVRPYSTPRAQAAEPRSLGRDASGVRTPPRRCSKAVVTGLQVVQFHRCPISVSPVNKILWTLLP